MKPPRTEFLQRELAHSFDDTAVRQADPNAKSFAELCAPRDRSGKPILELPTIYPSGIRNAGSVK